MRTVTLTRNETGDEGTFGTLVTDSGFTCATGELPWRDNEPNESAVPPGIYIGRWRFSPKHGMCYHIENVPGRTDIEVHAANFMGDTGRGFKCELRGCIAPGQGVGYIDGQQAILSSAKALKDLVADLNEEDFELTISQL